MVNSFLLLITSKVGTIASLISASHDFRYSPLHFLIPYDIIKPQELIANDGRLPIDR